ncbi:hypothetical protein BC833DRAFT_596860 [Globomyces pollinis-pini]|nr:hypothetical protein BC833DRAFT_596860 [Globomyces pollinis-pini]
MDESALDTNPESHTLKYYLNITDDYEETEDPDMYLHKPSMLLFDIQTGLYWMWDSVNWKYCNVTDPTINSNSNSEVQVDEENTTQLDQLSLVVSSSNVVKENSIIVFGNTTVSIGRDRSLELRLRLNELSVSRHHCNIYFDEAFYIIDLGSTHGTFLNRRRLSEAKCVSERFLLKDGDRLEIGTSAFVVHFHETCLQCNPKFNEVISIAPTKGERKIRKSKENSIAKSPTILPTAPAVDFHDLVNITPLESRYIEDSEIIHQINITKKAAEYRSQAIEIQKQLMKPLIKGPKMHQKIKNVLEDGNIEETQPKAGIPKKSHISVPISKNNVGSRLLQKMGWKEGTGLGPQSAGITDPVPLSNHKGRKGLGSK